MSSSGRPLIISLHCALPLEKNFFLMHSLSFTKNTSKKHDAQFVVAEVEQLVLITHLCMKLLVVTVNMVFK